MYRPATLRRHLLALALGAVGCLPPPAPPSPDAAPDAPPAKDASSPDAPADTAAPDAPADRAPPPADVAPDAPRDASADRDAPADATADADVLDRPDATAPPDVSLDAAPDAPRLDAAPDVAPDALPDAAPDAPPAGDLRPVSPLSTYRVASHRPTFRVALPSGATRACVELCRERACSMRVGVEATTGASLRWPTALAAGAYFWRVAPWAGACGVGRGPVWSLRVTARDVDLPSAWSFGDDVDADGRDDAVLPAQGVAWLGDGRLLRFRATLHPVQDLDGDGYPDWALPLADRITTEVYAGGADGPGTRLLARLTTRVIGEAFGAGDLNADGYGDLFWGLAFGGSPEAGVWFGGPTGPAPTFGWSDDAAVLGGYFSETVLGVHAGDVDGDGLTDLGVYGYYSASMGGSAGIFHGPIGALTSATMQCLSGGLMGLAGDVNGDGRTDTVYRCQAGPDTSAFLLLAAGDPARSYPRGARLAAGALAEALGDVNGDGFDDVARRADGAPRVALGDRALTLPDGGPLPAGEPAASGDFDGDGVDDVVVRTATGLALHRGGPAGVSATPARSVALP